LYLFQPLPPSHVLLLLGSRSLWRSRQWLHNSPESKLPSRLRMARPAPHSPAKLSMFRRQPPLVSQTFSEADLAAELLPLSFLRGPFLSPVDRRCFPSRDQPRH